MTIEYIKQKKDGSVEGGPFADGAIYIHISDESPLWDQIRDWMATGGVIDPVDPPPVPVTIVDALDFWSRMTNEEADIVYGAMETQPFRIRKIFETAQTFRSDHELWPLLTQMANQLFSEERAAAILAPSQLPPDISGRPAASPEQPIMLE